MAAAPLIIGLGEVLWDLLPEGRQLGGAPANFAYHASALGALGAVISRVGDDALGREILERLDGVGLNRRHVTVDPLHPTGVVDVTLDASGVPSYIIRSDVAWDFITANAELLEVAKTADAVCYGTLGQRAGTSRASIREFIASTKESCLRIFDINLRQHYYSRELVAEMLRQSDIFKLNDQELPIVMKLLGLSAEGEEKSVRAIIREFPVRLIALTRGGSGSALYPRNGGASQHPGFSAAIVDTVGAGDSFTAALAFGMLQGHELDRINTFANRLAAYVCSRSGAMPEIPDTLKQMR